MFESAGEAVKRYISVERVFFVAFLLPNSDENRGSDTDFIFSLYGVKKLLFPSFLTIICYIGNTIKSHIKCYTAVKSLLEYANSVAL